MENEAATYFSDLLSSKPKLSFNYITECHNLFVLDGCYFKIIYLCDHSAKLQHAGTDGCFKSAFGTFPMFGKPYKQMFNILVYS